MRRLKFLPLIALLLVPLLLAGPVRAATLPPLGTATNFAVLAGTTVTNTGPTVVTGDLGVSPGTLVTGFPPGTVNGTIHAGDPVAPQAQADALVAYNNAAGQPCDTNLTGQNLGGLTLTPGVYCFNVGAFLTGNLTLDGQGNPNAVFIFQIGSMLNTSSNDNVVRINGAQACRVFWQVGGSATLETGTNFQGNILALNAITLTTGSTSNGGLYALNGAVTLDTNQVHGCGAGGPTATPSNTPTRTAVVPTNTPSNTPTRTAVVPTNTPSNTPTQTAVVPTNTPTETPTACTSSALQNGGFETGTFDPWTVAGTDPPPVVSPDLPHSGTYSSLLGTVSGAEPTGDGSIYQTITVPTGGGTLSYWWTGGTTDSITYDWQDAYLTDTSGTILATIMHTCQTTGGYINQMFDLAPYAGQTVRVEFLVHQDGLNDDTYMYVDDVAVLTACSTPTPAATATAGAGLPTETPLVPSPTPTPVTGTPTPCTISFSDVQPADYFYTPVLYLACHGVISGYSGGTFRPYANTTRSQMVKIVVLGFAVPITTPAGGNDTFADVQAAFPFFAYIETAAAHNIVSGYACGGPGEPCDGQHRPYFRPYNSVTRGQLAKIVVGAAGWLLVDPAVGTFADVAPGGAFYLFVQTAYCHGVVSGYACGGPGEPCGNPPRPYFRQYNNATRGQIAKIVYLSITTSSTCTGLNVTR